jgi:methyl-accepting chemotaxis protein
VHRLSRLAEGDLSVDYMARGGDEIGQLINALNDARAQLKILIRQIRSSSQSIDTAAEGIAQTNSALSIRELPQSQSV